MVRRAVLAVLAWVVATARAARDRLPSVDVLDVDPQRLDGTPAASGGLMMDDRGQTASKRAKTAAGIVSSVGLVGLFEQYGIGGIAYSMFLEIIGVIGSITDVVTAPFEAFGGGLSRVISAVFPARIINAAADYTAFTLTEGEWSIFGPATFAVGVIATLVGIYVFIAFIRKFDLTIFGALLDRR